MISVHEATSTILSHLYSPQSVLVPIEKSGGRVLAEPIFADRDFPPFDRVTMDGIAIDFSAWKEGIRHFRIEKTVAAGEPQGELQNRLHAIEVMTGAVLPKGTNTVIRYEDIKIQDGVAEVIAREVTMNQSVHHRGIDAGKDVTLLEQGIKISAAEVALMASIGKQEVLVNEFPKTAIIGSGDELVPISATPLPHQVRRSNTYAIFAAMNELGWAGTLHHLADDPGELEIHLSRLLEENDLLILSGGVSKGKFDYIPVVLEKLGVRKIFHEVSQRPGKPMWFGVKNDKRVFALPGNPVSTFMCFYKYVKPWLSSSLRCATGQKHAVLATDFTFQPRLTYFLQVRVLNEDGKLMAYPDQGGGSGDFANLKKIDGFLELTADRSEFKAGEVFPYIPFRL